MIFFCKNWDVTYQHMYLGHPINLKGVGANIILGDFISATPSANLGGAQEVTPLTLS